MTPDADLCCLSHGPAGAVCQKIRGHICDHGGMDTRGAWRCWLGGSICWCCGHPWPCPTIKALDGGSDE